MKRWTVLILSALAISAGCEREQAKPTVAPSPVAIAPPTTAPAIGSAAAAPATQPAATEPVGTLITIDQRYVDFPQARLKVTTDDQGMTALLYSVDPPTAINNDYSGNSFYLLMPLKNAGKPGSLDGAEWRFKAESSDRTENSKYGFFLQGLRYHLEPQDVLVKIDRNGTDLRIRIAGQFLAYDAANKSELGAITPVSGDFTATLEENKPEK